ncbi:MAG: 4-hydroxy-tetrahydrodipicolinate reductase [Deltaproteobacteria bacterium]|nr:MAG: 4-hydroxy-tetrahydrodipicolinate reductase [Deltaproteobacteria bacterium]
MNRQPAADRVHASQKAGRAKVCLIGAAGRMGRRCVRLLEGHPQLRLSAVWLRQGQAPLPLLEAVQSANFADLAEHSDVFIDFTAPPACQHTLPPCAAAGRPYVLASTGLSPADEAAIAQAKGQLALLQAANLSPAVAVLRDLVARAARALPDYDVEICEIHHRHKRDAPSGTARLLAAAVQGTGERAHLVLGRNGAEPRRDGRQIGVAALRGGEVVGEHTAYFFGEAERLEVSHRSSNPDLFAIGALRAACFVLRQAPGHYDMQDMLAQA